ncbi:MAG: hypothetical protein DHS20C18_53560 [Saprospiraceae bacterium]|nr:MAG: hypothetical protein DHS20C18_53560 [Saprospiraceae bacterium]
MDGFFKKIIEFLHGILAPLAKKLADPQARTQFHESLGFQQDPNAPEPDFPDGSAMDAFLKNEKENEEALLFAQSLQEIARIIDALKGMYRAGAETYYAINPGDSDRTERIDQAISELITLTINIFMLDYIRFRFPTLHNLFKILGVVDEMGQRAGSDGSMIKVVGDYLNNFGRGFKLADEKSVHTAVEAIGLVLNVLKFSLFKDAKIFFSPGFETYSKTLTPHADDASKGMLSLGWFFQKDELVQGNLLLTLGMIPRTRAGGGFFAKVDAPASFEKKFTDFLALRVEAEGDLDFFFANDIGFDLEAGKANRASVMVKGTPTPKSLSLLSTPELSVGYNNKHSLEFRFSRDDIGVIVKTEVNIKFGRGKAKAFPFGFIPESQFEETIPLNFGWSNKRGLFFGDAGTVGANPNETENGNGTSGTALRGPGDSADGENAKPNLFFFNVPIRASFFGLTFQNIHLGLGKDGNTTIFETSLDFTFVLGKVFTLAVTRLGVRGFITPREDMKGLLGQDIDLDFKPPTGIGISVDIGLLKGGGFVSLDDEKGEYFGALELEVDLSCIAFTLKAFGIIQTKLPGAAEDEYSLFVVISSEFEPIPLIFGLTLNGVGGLFGHNRSADVSLIQSEMRSPALENILFLKDPIANISRLVTDSGRYFPVEIDKTLFGISLKIGYAKIFELSLAVIFVKPEKKIIVPGFLRLETPKKSKILNLQVNFLGILDRQEGYFFFRADLVNSKFATFKLTGSLVFATGWGDSDGLFAISIGGFHPSYKHFPEIKALPNAFRGLDRLRISLWESGKDHLYLELYMAFTSNSRQFGAHAYLHVEGPMSFNIDGHLGLDVLWQTEPVCYFEANLEARIDFRHGNEVLAGVGLTALFSGPTPKHIEGKARLKICWFLTVSIPFNKTWGEPGENPAVETADLLQMFIEQVEDDRNWRPEIPDFHHLHVSLRNDPDKEVGAIVLQPLGAVLFSQRELPLNQKIEKVGVRKPKDLKTIKIDKVSTGGTNFVDLKPITELFAPGQFIELKEDEKLARPSFERMNGGVRLGDTAVSEYPTPFVKAKDADYELAYIAPDLPPQKGGRMVLTQGQFQLFTRQSAVAQSKLSWQAGSGLTTAPKAITYKTSGFAIAGADDLKLFTNGTTTGYQAKSQSEAEQIKAQILAENPALEGKIQVVAEHELAV